MQSFFFCSTPSLYKINTGNNRLTWKYFIGWILLAVYHSVIIYYFSYAIFETNNAILWSSQIADLPCFGTILVHNVVVLVNLKLWLVARYQSFIFILTILGSISAFMISTVIYNYLNMWVIHRCAVYESLIYFFLFFVVDILLAKCIMYTIICWHQWHSG